MYEKKHNNFARYFSDILYKIAYKSPRAVDNHCLVMRIRVNRDEMQ